MKQRDKILSEAWVQIVHTLPIETSGGKQNMNCSDTEGLFRIIQSIPFRKAEPFKKWLARVGYERVQEIENPELAQERMKQLYEQKRYSRDWIEKRRRNNTSDEICEDVPNTIINIINEENAKIQMRAERIAQVRA